MDIIRGKVMINDAAEEPDEQSHENADDQYDNGPDNKTLPEVEYSAVFIVLEITNAEKQENGENKYPEIQEQGDQ